MRRSRKPFRGRFLRRGFESLPLRLVKCRDIGGRCPVFAGVWRPVNWHLEQSAQLLEGLESAPEGCCLPHSYPLTEPVDIKAVAGKKGLSQQTASYALKKFADKGLLTQSSVDRGRGVPRLVFALASNGQVG